MRYKMSKGNIAEKLENAMLEIERLEKLVDAIPAKSAATDAPKSSADHQRIYNGIEDPMQRAQYRQLFSKELGIGGK